MRCILTVVCICLLTNSLVFAGTPNYIRVNQKFYCTACPVLVNSNNEVFFVTAGHALQRGDHIEVFVSNKYVECEKITYVNNKTSDMGIFKLKNKAEYHIDLYTLGDDVKALDSVTCEGFGTRKPWKGRIKKTNNYFTEIYGLNIEGDSGGPVVSNGVLVGMQIAYLKKGIIHVEQNGIKSTIYNPDNTVTFVPVHIIKSYLKEHKIMDR